MCEYAHFVRACGQIIAPNTLELLNGRAALGMRRRRSSG
jgi:hypothetical protein